MQISASIAPLEPTAAQCGEALFGLVFSLIPGSFTRDLCIGFDIDDARSWCFQQCIISRAHVSRGNIFLCRWHIILGCSYIKWLYELRLG